jgi:hypothetical protein
MNPRDQANLEFLLALTPERLAQWYNQANEDDINYATELLSQYEDQLEQEEFELGQEEYGVAFVQQSSTVH